MAAENSLSGYEYYRELKEILSSRDAYRLAYMSNSEFNRDIGELARLQTSLRYSIPVIQGNMSMYEKTPPSEKDIMRRNTIQSVIDGLGLGDQFSVESVWRDKAAQERLVGIVESFIQEVGDVAKEAGNMRWSYFRYDDASSEDENAIRNAEEAANLLLKSCGPAYEGGYLHRYLAELLNGNTTMWSNWRRLYDDIVRSAVLLRGKMSSDYRILDRVDFGGLGLKKAELIADQVIKFHFKDRTMYFSATRSGYDRRIRDLESELSRGANTGGIAGKMDYVPEGTSFADSGFSVRELASLAHLTNYKIYARSVMLRRKTKDPQSLETALNSGDAEQAKSLLGGLTRNDKQEADGLVDEIMRLRRDAAKLFTMRMSLSPEQAGEFNVEYMVGGENGIAPLWEPNYNAMHARLEAQERKIPGLGVFDGIDDEAVNEAVRKMFPEIYGSQST